MKLNFRRFLAMFLSIVMVAGMLPAAVFAEDGVETTTYVAKVGNTECADAAALISALNAASGEVTVEIYDKITIAELGLNNANITKLSFVGKDTDAEICVDGVSYIDVRYTSYPIEYTSLILSHINAGQNIDGFLPQYFSTYNGGNVTYTSCTFPNGVTACGSTANTTYTFNQCTFNNTTSGLYSLWVYGNSTNVVINGGTFSGVRGIKMYSEGSNDFSTLSVTGATFSNTITEKHAIVLTKGESITLTGNTFENTTGTVQVDDNYASSIEGKTVTIDGKAYTVNSADKKLDEVAPEVTYVAEVNGTKHETLDAAFAAAQAGDTIVLLANQTFSGQNAADDLSGYVIDLNDKTITLSGNTYLTGETTIKNGNIVVSGFVSDSYLCLYTAATKLTLDDVSLTGTMDCYAVLNAATGSTLIIKNSTIDVIGNVTNPDAMGNIIYGGNVTVDNSTIKGVDTVRGIGFSNITIQNGSTVNISDVETGLNCATVTVDNSTVTITNATKRAVRLNNNTLTLQNGATLTATGCAEDIIGIGTTDVVSVSSDSTLNAKDNVTPAGPVKVTTYEELIAALEKDNANVIMMNDITATATQASSYGKAGIVLGAGDVLDGNNFTLTINGANSTWDCAIAMTGGEVKNLTIAGAMRGVFMPGANGDVVIDNCVFKDVIYTFNSDAGSKDYTVTIKNTTLNGWTSFSDVHKSVTFEECSFGEGNGYQFCRPYQATTFTKCSFDEGFQFDTAEAAKAGDNNLAFNECTYNGTALSAKNNAMFYNGGSVVINGVPTDVTPPTGSNSYAYTKEEKGYVRVWGEGGGNAKKSFVLKLYSGDTLIATTQLNNIGGIIDGDVYVTWNFFYPASTDEYWTTTWEEGHPNADAQPTKVELIIDGTVVAITDAMMSGADGVNPVIWSELGGVNKVAHKAIQVTYADGTVAYFDDMLEAVPYTTNYDKLQGATIKLLADVTGKGIRFMENGMVLDLNEHTYTINNATGSSGTNTSGFQIREEASTATIKNGTIKVAEPDDMVENTSVIWMFNSYSADFTVENVTIDCANMAWGNGENCYVHVSRSGDNTNFTGTTKVINFNSEVAGNAINVGGTMTIGKDVVPGGAVELDAGATLSAPASATVTTSVANSMVKYENGTYKVVPAVAKIGNTYYETFAAALDAVQDGDTITLLEVEGSEISKEIEFTKDIEFTITGTAPNYALPIVTFQNATVNIEDATILIPELDARQNATINVIDSTVYDAGGNSIVKSYYNGAINISGTSVVYTMQVTTMGYITVSDIAKLNATWQTNVYGNGMITVKEDAQFNTAALQLTGKEYSGRDNTDADRVGQPATIVVDGATFIVGSVKSSNGADYSYNSSSYGVNIGTIEGKSAVLDIKNGATVQILIKDGSAATVGADGTVRVNDSTLNGVNLSGAGTTEFCNTVNFYGDNVVNTTKLDGSPFHLIVNKGATLLITRFVLGYDRAITVYGEIEDAHDFEPTGKTPSLKFNSTSGVGVGGYGTGNLTVEDAYIELGNSSWKNAQGTYTWHFKNSYVSATSFTNCNAPSSDSASWTVTFDDSVLAAKNHIKNGVRTTYNFINGSVATTGSMRIDGELYIDETSSVTTTSYQNNTVGAQDEHGDITGTVKVDGTLTIGSNAALAVELRGGELHIGSTGKVDLTQCPLTIDADSKVVIDATGMSAGDYTNLAGTVVNNGTLEVIKNNSLTAEVQNGKIVLVKKTDVAKIGEQGFTSFAEAIAAAKSGDTIVLLADITEDVTIDENLTIDGAKKKYTGTMTVNAGLTVTVENVNFVNGGIDKSTKSTTGTYTIKNCTFTDDGNFAYAFRFRGANKVTIEDCTVKGYMYSFLYITSGTNSVSVKNVTVEDCPNYAVYFASGVNSATIENLTVKNSNNGFIINNTANRALNIKNCTMKNVTTAINHSNGTNAITCTVLGVNDFGAAATSEYAKYVLGATDATLTASNGLNVTSGVDGYEVKYADGKYALVEVELKEFYGSSVTMGNELDLNFFFSKAYAENTGYAQIVRTYGDGRADETTTVPLSSVKLNGDYYQIIYEGIAAKEMCDELKVTIFDQDDNQISETKVDSIRSYAIRVINSNSTSIDSTAKTMMVDMLNYGAAAQEYLNYNTSDLANSTLTDEQKALGTQEMKACTNNFSKSNDSYYGTSFEMGNELSLKMYVKKDAIGADGYVVVTYTNHLGHEKTATINTSKLNGNYYEFFVNEIVVADGRCLLTCTFYKADGTEVVTVKDSLESYVARGVSAYPWLEKVMNFSDSAHAYLHRNDK